MNTYYQIDVEYTNGETQQLRYESIEEAVEVISDMVSRPDVDSATLLRFDNKHPKGFFILCGIRDE